MKKRFLALTLAAAMAAGVLAGCGNSGAANSGTTGSTGGTTSGAASTESKSASVGAASADAVQNLINNTSGTVELTVWASEEDQDFTQSVINDFTAQYPEVNFKITLGAESESTAKDTVLADVEAAADVFAFAHDQINDLVNAGALQEVVSYYTYDVATENVAGSVDAATVNGKLYAYPMTADNGYFMFYDKSVIKDPSSLEKMIEDAQAAGKKIAIEFSNSWYLYGFFRANGLEASLNADGKTNSCNWNAPGGTDVAQAVLDAVATGTVVNMDDGTTVTGIADGTVCAAINGIWNAQAAQAAWGDNYMAAKLPTMKIGGQDKQIYSYSGFKLIGVNQHSKQIGWSILLAEYLTNEQTQLARYEARGLGPANIKAAATDKVKNDLAVAALAAQAEFSTPQVIGGNYWDPANTLGQILASGNPDGTDLQTLLDTAVEGITAAAN